MPFRAWMFIAAFGLISVASLLEAQEQTEGPENGAGNQEQPAESLPLPFPVQIIEDNEAATARQRKEDEAEQREKDDLVAQQGMNTATQAMNEATQSMKYASWVSAGLVGLGTLLLVWTLRLTRQAVAVTREFGQKQLRPYLGLNGTTSGFRSGVADEAGKVPKVLDLKLRLKNAGQTPATEIIFFGGWEIFDGISNQEILETAFDENEPFNTQAGPSCGSQDTFNLPPATVDTEMLEKMKRGESTLVLYARLEYRSIVEPGAKYGTSICVKADIIGDEVSDGGSRPYFQVRTIGSKNRMT